MTRRRCTYCKKVFAPERMQQVNCSRRCTIRKADKKRQEARRQKREVERATAFIDRLRSLPDEEILRIRDALSEELFRRSSETS